MKTEYFYRWVKASEFKFQENTLYFAENRQPGTENYKISVEYVHRMSTNGKEFLKNGKELFWKHLNDWDDLYIMKEYVSQFKPTSSSTEPSTVDLELVKDDFRMIISHALLGYEDNVTKEDWELVFTECAKYHTSQKISQEGLKELVEWVRNESKTRQTAIDLFSSGEIITKATELLNKQLK